MDLDVTTRSEGDVRVIAVVGELDVHTAPSLREELIRVQAEQPPRLVVDLSGIAFCDSTGLGVLVGALARAREGSTDFRLAAPQERLARLFRLTGLDASFDVRSTLAAAVAD